MNRVTQQVKQLQALSTLSYRLAVADFKLRNEGSYLGLLWYFLHPLFMFLVLYVVFVERLGSGIDNYAVYLLIGVLLFNFFTRTTLDAAHIVRSSTFIKSFRFDRQALVLATVLKHLFAHCFEILLFFSALIFLGVPVYALFLYVPWLLLLTVFVYGCSLVLATATVFFSDLANVWSFFTTLLWFATPIFYELENQPALSIFNAYNPLYYYIESARQMILGQAIPEFYLLLGAVLGSTVAMSIGLFVFTRLQHRFAEML